MSSGSQPTLQQQLAAAQEQIQWLNEQNLQMNGELSRLRASNPQTSHIPVSIHQPRPFFPQNQPHVPQQPFVQPQISQPFIPPQVSQVSLPPPPPANNLRPIFPPLPSGPYPGTTTFTYNQPQAGPRPFVPFPEPISHVPTAATPITHIPNLSNDPGTSSNPPITDIVDVRLKMLEEQNKAMLALLTKLPGAAVPIEVEPKTGFQASPYIDEIALVDIPKKYNIPSFTPKYSGITDPVEHITKYKQLVWTVPIPTQFQEICMCKGFGSTLTGAALQWLINLKPKSIASWSELVNQFTRQFASSRKMEKQTSDLYYVVQKIGETIRDYFNRFNTEMIEVKNCDVRTAIEAYKRGLDTSSELYTDLTKYPPENFDDVRARTLAHMRIEDDAIFRRKHSNDKKNLGAQKHDFKPKRVNKIENSRRDHNKRSNQGTGKVRYPDLSTYHFAGTTKDLVDSLRNLEVNVRWPKKPENPSKDKDQTKWCDFHNDHGHNTDDCISLKKEIAYLKSNGHLKNLLDDSSKRPTSPVPTKVVNCITGGSDVCGLTYSAAKRHAREGPEGHPIPSESRSTDDKELDATKISFDIEDMSDAHQKHHDALVIQLTIGNCLTKRVLIDGGSSANVIFAETLKIMGIDRSSIVRRTTMLIGFNGDATNTLGEIILPVFAKGINKQTKFNVIDCPSAYNAILGRPWIHDMKAVPSTYHQKIKFPSPWGSQDGVRSYDDLQLEEVVLDHKHPDRKVFIGATLTPDIKNSIMSFLDAETSFDLTYQPRTAIKSQALADFVAEFSPGIEEPSIGSCPEIITWGSMVYSIRCEFKTTNNEAEYEALIAGLDMAYNLGARWLHVRSDSLLVVNQINGEFQAKDSKMISYLKIAKDKIARFDKFSIEQIPRDLNMQADALANLGSAFNEPTQESVPIIHLMSPTIEEVQMIEENHDWSLDIWNYLKNDQLPEDKLEARKVRLKSSRYTIFDDQLYRRSTTGLILRCVVNKRQIGQILQEMHDGECGNHSGGRSLANRISRQGYYWPTLREDSIRYVQKCDACQRHSGTSHLPSEPLHSVLIPWPFMRWGMDIVGKLPPAPGQKVFLLVLTDYFSKWIEAAAFSQRLKTAKGRWVEELASVLWANRTTPRTSTGQTPFSLVYGCEAVLLIESQVPVARHRTIEQNSIDLCYDIDALEELREKAFQKMASQKAMVERYFNKKVKIKVFQVRDHVLRRVFPNTQESNAGKLSIKWEGPYIITKIVGKGAYKISTNEGNEIPHSWNATHLKRYYF
ncbi:hypothetical protein OSB04_019647 [Centaurea solstitialis]|uniref:Uncharacterized protein n=1 Tax=Centaurea solstitialis TaxID=347529 RepID=A0AA38SSD7_9ASTR|nr:hypothetical protein OSB04_019647 [Centaurea solstitialis]